MRLDPSGGGIEDVVLSIGQPISEELDEIDGEYLTRPKAEQPRPKRIKARERLGQVWDGFSTTLFTGSVREFLVPVRGVVEFIRNRVGADPTLPIVELPDHAFTLLPPAIQAVRDCEQLLRDEVPAALRWIDLKKVAIAVTVAEDMDGLSKIVTPLLHGVRRAGTGAASDAAAGRPCPADCGADISGSAPMPLTVSEAAVSPPRSLIPTPAARSSLSGCGATPSPSSSSAARRGSAPLMSWVRSSWAPRCSLTSSRGRPPGWRSCGR